MYKINPIKMNNTDNDIHILLHMILGMGIAGLILVAITINDNMNILKTKSCEYVEKTYPYIEMKHALEPTEKTKADYIYVIENAYECKINQK